VLHWPRKDARENLDAIQEEQLKAGLEKALRQKEQRESKATLEERIALNAQKNIKSKELQQQEVRGRVEMGRLWAAGRCCPTSSV
jgi:hypothetical protein